MKIVLYGGGCQKCVQLLENVQAALDTLGIHADIEKVTDAEAIANANLPAKPALEIDGRIVAAGEGLSVEELLGILSKNAEKNGSCCSCGCGSPKPEPPASCCCEKEPEQKQTPCCCCSKPASPGKRLLIYILLTILGLAVAIIVIGKFH